MALSISTWSTSAVNTALHLGKQRNPIWKGTSSGRYMLVWHIAIP